MSPAELIRLIFYVFYGALITRVVLSFLIPMMGARPHPLLAAVANVVHQITEPLLAPIRRVLPTFGTLDFSPMIAMILLVVIQEVLVRRLS
jgi:YggT family protein